MVEFPIWIFVVFAGSADDDYPVNRTIMFITFS